MFEVEHLTSKIIDKLSYDYSWTLIQLIQKVLNKPVFKVLFIHDEFKCHPNYMNYVRQIYIDLMAELADSRIMNAILSDITGETIVINKLSDDLSNEIRTSEYAIC